MQEKERKCSTNNLESETTEFMDNEISIKLVHHEPTDICEARVQRHEHVKDAKKPDKNELTRWMKLSKYYLQYFAELIKRLSEFESRWNGHLRGVKMAQYRIAL